MIWRLLTLFIFILPATSFGASATDLMGLEIVTPLSVTSQQSLEFGTFAKPISGSGTISVSQGGVSTTGGVMLVNTGPTRAPARFGVVGDENLPYTFTIPSSVALTGPGSNIAVALSFDTGSCSGTSCFRTLSSSGTDTVYVKGTLTVPSSQSAGSYTRTFSVTANY